MDENIKQLEYIKSQLAWIKSKVELDNQLGLHDINKLGEDIFMHILNDIYDLNLKNANNVLHDDFPSIDLIDEVNQKVIQVTSTKTLKKAKDTVKKLKELKFHEITDKTSNSLKKSISLFRQFKNYKEYELSFLYLKEKPNITIDGWKSFLKEEELDQNNILGMDNIINIIQSNPAKCQTLYKTIQQRLDNISFKFNIDSHFKQVEPHLIEITDSKFEQYKPQFVNFITSDKKILEVYAVGGSGKSHLLRYFSHIETEYIPLIFTKQINIEEDLKKLDSDKNYLFIFDDIDRYLEQHILLNLLAYAIGRENIKLLLSYRTPSKSAIETIYRKYSNIKRQELEITWEHKEIILLINTLLPTLQEEKTVKLAYTFNNNPYLITQAIRGDIKSTQEFSKKIIDDTKSALNEFKLNDKKINDLLFNLSLLSPISKNNISKEYKGIINKLVDRKILRELASKYRFNPDIVGDLYLANYIDENKNGFEELIIHNLKEFSDTVFTNLSYALAYNKSDSLQNFIKNIINKWIENKEYRNDYLALINKVVYYAPMESFIYLDETTKNLKVSNELSEEDKKDIGKTLLIVKDNMDCIKLENIEPIISKLVYALKNNIPCEELNIQHIIKYLISNSVTSLPKPYYDNQTLDSIFQKIVSPLNTRNTTIITDTLSIMQKWLYETLINDKKIYLLTNSIQKLLNGTFETNYYDVGAFHFKHTSLNLQNKKVLEILEYAKNILLRMLKSENIQIIYQALETIPMIGNGFLYHPSDKENEELYNDIKKEALLNCIDILKCKQEIKIVTKIEDVAMYCLNFSPFKDEALLVLKGIHRTNEYMFYQIVKNTDLLIFDYDKFYRDCKKENDINNWIHEKKKKKIGEERPTTDEWDIIDSISDNYADKEEYLSLLNNLDISSWNSNNLLMRIFRKWIKNDNKVFIDIAIDHLEELKDEKIRNILYEASLAEGITTINIENITKTTKEDNIKIYINAEFKNFNQNSFNILQKIIDVSQNKDANYKRWIISLISGDMYFKIRENKDFYNDFEPFIIQFLDWQLENNLSVESYITHHILYDVMLPLDKISSKVKSRLKQIVHNENIPIDEFELEPIYKILDYGLNEVIDILYSKLTSKDENQKPKHVFTHYFDYDKITEVMLLKSYIKSYDDFKILVEKVCIYFSNPIQFIGVDGNHYEDYINLDYFFKYTVNQEYLEKLFNELIQKNDIKNIKFLYKIVPISSEYIEIIIRNLNLLEDEIDDKDFIAYLTQEGKIKSWSRSHMQNSDLLLSEEALFINLSQKIDSLSLKIKLKEELKYIELNKRREIEDDIASILAK